MPITRTLVTLLLSAAAITAAAQTTSAPTPEEQAVLAPINAFFDGMAARDATAIRQTTLPGGTMILSKDGQPFPYTIDEFATRVGKPSPSHIDERIHSPLIRIDQNLAVVWAPFVFTLDGKPHHCGIDLFNLVRKDGRWLIAFIADTESACPAN